MRRYTPEDAAAGTQRVRELLVANLTEPDTSEWSSRATFVKKNNGYLRLSCNYVGLNKVTNGVELPIPDIIYECKS